MRIIVCSIDGRKHIWSKQPADLEEDLALAVSSGLGFTLKDEAIRIAYAPGQVARVSFQKEDK